jgi:trans-aconitate methyltransferase
MNKICIDERYFPNEELSHSNLPYVDLLSCLDELFAPYNSLFDAGCRDGKLLEQIKIKHPNILINGCDYFQFAINTCHPSIKNDVFVWDLRDPFTEYKKYDLVVSTEVAEHIDKDYCDIYLNNLKKLLNKYVIITWSNSGGENNREFDQHLQHLNPLSKEEYHELMKKNGFKFEEEKTNNLVELMKTKKHIHWYWTNTIGVFSIKE